MIRKFTYNKIFRTTSMLILFLLLLIFPAYKKYSLEDVVSNTISSKNKLDEVFLIDNKGYIARTYFNVSNQDKIKYANNIIEMLIIDGKYYDEIPNGFMPILPSSTKINNIVINNDEITVDLSADFYDLPKENEEKALELIVCNLTLLDNINKVYVKIDNKLLDYLPNSKLIINQPLTKNNGINKVFDLYDYKNTKNVTVYYINSYNNKYYYVPVTKVTNDKRDKIKIIIEELTSNHTYETNLMSFINYNAKLIDYKILEDDLELNFNEYIFDDVKKEKILEEVIYTICLSIRDNYNVKNVIFKVNDKEILKTAIKDIE